MLLILSLITCAAAAPQWFPHHPHDGHPGRHCHLWGDRRRCVHSHWQRHVRPVHHRRCQVLRLPRRLRGGGEQGVQDLRARHLHDRRLRRSQAGHGHLPLLHDQRVPAVRRQHHFHCKGNGDGKDGGVREVHRRVQRRQHTDWLHQCCHVLTCISYK